MAGHILPLRTYFTIWALLLLLLGATVGLGFVHLGPLNVVAALTIAGIKAVLVILFFMHVRFSSALVWLAAGSGFYWLAILIGLTLADYATRNWLPIPGK
jgi:cytochrome c oxidase subunit 4